MADLHLTNFSLSERWDVTTIMQQRKQGSPFLSSSLEAYLDVGDTVALKYSINIAPALQSKFGM